MTTSPRALVERFESAPSLPPGSDERFDGYGVMGLPFASGHVLAMRRFPASSIGPGYTSVWHRTPDGRWVFYATVPPQQACTRFFGAAVSGAMETEIGITWTAPHGLRITVPAATLEWDVRVGPTIATRIMNTTGRLMPPAAWRSRAVLSAVGMVAGPLLGAGRVGMQGRVPNGQRFIANPRLLWAVTESRAVLAGEDFGLPGPVQPQAQLGDFWIPQRGMLAIGRAYFEPFDPELHSARLSQSRVDAV